MMKQSPGTILREKREAKKITIKAAAEDNNMTSRHLVALEEDNYAIFPGETYVLGFLRSYATYLGVDPDHMIQLYRGAQLVEKEVPLQELTKPTLTAFDHLQGYMKYILAALIIVVLAVIGLKIYDERRSGEWTAEDDGSQNRTKKETTKYPGPDVEVQQINFQSGRANAIVSVAKGVSFSVKNAEVYLVLEQLKYKQAESGTSEAVLLLYPGKEKLTLVENEGHSVKSDDLPRRFKVTLIGATPNNVKLEVLLGGSTQVVAAKSETDNGTTQETKTNPLNPDNFKIVFHGTMTSNNYVEVYVDGDKVQAGSMGTESNLRYEAEDSIQLKIGDAGAIKVVINGKEYKWGKPGQQVRKTIRKVRDPLAPTEYKIDVTDW